MSSTWFKNDWSIAGFLLFIAQFAWAVYLISIVMYSLFFLAQLFGLPMAVFFDLPARINIVDLNEFISGQEELTIFQNSTFQTDIHAINENLQNKWSYHLASAMKVGLHGIALYGLSLLKRILRSLRREQPWDQQNSTNLKTIGYLMLLAIPYKYGIGWLSYLTIRQMALPEKVSLLWPPVAWDIGLAGLAVILVAYIFEEGTRLYEEQKLTV